jgi:hypothetical protein
MKGAITADSGPGDRQVPSPRLVEVTPPRRGLFAAKLGGNLTIHLGALTIVKSNAVIFCKDARSTVADRHGSSPLTALTLPCKAPPN